MIFQSPWYEQGEYRGLVEISIPLPEEYAAFCEGEEGRVTLTPSIPLSPMMGEGVGSQ